MASSASHGSLAQKSYKLMSRDSQNVAKIKKAVYELQKKIGDPTKRFGKKDAANFVMKVFKQCDITSQNEDLEEVFDKFIRSNEKEIGADNLAEFSLRCYKSCQFKRSSSRRKSESKSDALLEKQAEYEKTAARIWRECDQKKINALDKIQAFQFLNRSLKAC